MSRRRRADESSLELLLDTITNTFGGILFLAILVSLLLRSSTPQGGVRSADASRGMSAADQADLEVKMEELQDRVARLLAVQQSKKSARPESLSKAEPDESELLAALARAIEERARVGLATAECQRKTAAAVEEATALAERGERASERRQAAERDRDAAAATAAELARVRLEMEPDESPATIVQTAGMPTLRSTDKQQVAVYVRFGKMFMMHAWRDGVRLGPNSEQFVVTPGNPPVARPKPATGVAVRTRTIAADLRRLLGRFPPTEWVVAVVVYSDSFEEFQLLKQAMVNAGYEYNPIPVKPGGSVFDSGGDSQAQ